MESKKNILIASRTSWHLKDWAESGFLEELNKKFNLYFFFVNYELSTDNCSGEFESDLIVNKLIYPYNKPWWLTNKLSGLLKKIQTFFKIFRPKLNQLAYFLNETNELIKIHKRENLIESLKHDGKHLRKIVNILLILKLAKLFSLVINFFLNKTSPKMVPRNINFDLCIIAYNSFNVGGYMDDLIRDSKKINLKTFGIQFNHDNLLERVPLELPNFLGVWGMQTFTWCTGKHFIPPYKMSIIGTPRYDLLLNIKDYKKEDAKKILNLPENSTVLLFCPSVRLHDEEFILQEIQKNINNKNLPENLYILYKDHEFKFDDFGKKKSSKILNLKLKNIISWSEIKKKNKLLEINNLKNFIYLYSASDAIISPFSTMCLEALMLGKPVMVYNYLTEDYGFASEYNMKIVRHRLYQYPIKKSDAVEICHSRADIKNTIQKILKKIGDNQIPYIAKQSAENSVLFNNIKSSQRIIDCANSIIGNNQLDKSYEYFK